MVRLRIQIYITCFPIVSFLKVLPSDMKATFYRFPINLIVFLILFYFVIGSNSSLNTSLPSPGAWPYSASDNSFTNVHSTSGMWASIISLNRPTHFSYCT